MATLLQINYELHHFWYVLNGTFAALFILHPNQDGFDNYKKQLPLLR